MKKFMTFLMGAAMMAPLYLATPAHAQSRGDIQRLEEQVQEAKQRGDWGYATDLERQLNVERLQYQRNNGLGENNDNSQYMRFNVNNNNGYRYQNNNRNRYNNRYRNNNRVYNQQQNNGYYDQNGNWRRY